MNQRHYLVPPAFAGMRADAGLAKLTGMSRSNCAQLLESECVSMNGRVIDKSVSLVEDATLEVTMPEVVNALEIKESFVEGFRIVFQDEHIVVVDKPAGVAAHPSVGWDGPTVPGALLALGVQLSTSGAAERQGIVQRLDVGTSGLMVLAKSELAYSRLKQAFRDRTVSKTYHALVQGHPDPASGTIDAPIGRSPKFEFKFMVSSDGKPSITHYRTLEMLRATALMEIELETGRTHQIRVHFSAFHHPLVGDSMYGADPTLATKFQIERQWLHAVKLSFAHPISQELVSFSSPYSADLNKALELARNY
jgi:23S rRNA pseudouridine1911/1915/1917 synthase